MKFYKDSNGEVRGYESDGSQDHLIPKGFMLMTAAEVESHINPPKTAAQIALEQIAAIEVTITQRRLREAVQGIDGGWLAAREAEIAAIRATL